MPAYNAEKYIEEAIESILAQTYSDFEFIILNDGSTDATGDIIARYAKKDMRIVVIDSQENRGLAFRENEGIAHARGEYIARMDADDVSMPTRFAKEVTYLDAHPKCAVVGSSIVNIDSEGKPTSARWIFRATPEETKIHFLFTNYVAHPTVMMRKAFIPADGYRAYFEPTDDFDLWVRISESHDIYSLSEPLLKYRTHMQNTSTLKTQRVYGLVREILKRQLEALGISVSEDDAVFHNELSFDGMKYDAAGLARAAVWYEKIYYANLIAKKYDRVILLTVLLGRWLVLCARQDAGWFLPGKPFWHYHLILLPGLFWFEKIEALALILRKSLRYGYYSIVR